MADDTEHEGRKAWRWALPLVVYFFVSTFLDDWIADRFTTSMHALVSIGGYGLSNLVVGLLVGTACHVCYVLYQRKLLDLQVNGDPEPLRPPYDYQTQAQAGLWLGWLGGVGCWILGAAMLFLWYPAAWVFGPIVGTTLIVAGHRRMAHARIMDAQRERTQGAQPLRPGLSRVQFPRPQNPLVRRRRTTPGCSHGAPTPVGRVPCSGRPSRTRPRAPGRELMARRVGGPDESLTLPHHLQLFLAELVPQVCRGADEMEEAGGVVDVPVTQERWNRITLGG